MLEPAFFRRLKERKLVQWALAYLAAAFVVFQLLDALAEPLGLSQAAQRTVLVLVAVGFLVTLLLAWYHGEKGQQRVSGTELLILAALLVTAAFGVRLVWRTPLEPEAEGIVGLPAADRSVAVLPLQNLSPTDEYAFFAGAMTEEITSALTEVPELVVKSRSSAAKFPESGLSVSEFARNLGVSHVIEGSVQRSGDRVRITVLLTRARTAETLWVESYERQLLDLFALQVEVARQVADRLAASFTERERESILATATDDPVAYDRYLRATVARSDVDTAIELLGEAVRGDPSFWPAWEELAFDYLAKEARGDGAQWADSSRAAFRRAAELTDNRPTKLRLEAYQAMIFGGDEEEAMARLRGAAEERPSDVALAGTLGELYRIRGRLPEAVRWRRRAAQLDPLQAHRWQALFQPYWWLQMYEESGQALNRARDLDPQNPEIWQQTAWHWMVQHRFEEALAAADSARTLGPEVAPLNRALVHWWSGDSRAAVEAYRAAMSDLPADPPEWQQIPMAHAHFAVGDSIEGRRIMEEIRGVLESRVIDDYEPEWRVFPRLQLAAMDGDRARAVDLFRVYVERGGRDPTWFRQSPLFSRLREEPAFLMELDELDRLVTEMRRQVVRDLANPL